MQEIEVGNLIAPKTCVCGLGFWDIKNTLIVVRIEKAKIFCARFGDEEKIECAQFDHQLQQKAGSNIEPIGTWQVLHLLEMKNYLARQKALLRDMGLEF